MTVTQTDQTLTLADMLATGATYRQIDYWVRRGYLTPPEPLPGSGYQRQWTPRDRELVLMILRLSEVVTMEHAVTMAQQWVDEGVHEFEFNGITIWWAPPTSEERSTDGDAGPLHPEA